MYRQHFGCKIELVNYITLKKEILQTMKISENNTIYIYIDRYIVNNKQQSLEKRQLICAPNPYES